MQDAPPVEIPPDPPGIEAPADQQSLVASHLPMTEKAGGSVVIDLKPLAPEPIEEECLGSDPNPLDNGIVVCAQTTTDQRLTSAYGPVDEPDEFASAIPRARVKLSEDAEAEANVINKGVGGFNANGGEVRVKIDF